MAKKRFIEFVLKPSDLGRLTQVERTHLLNNTMGWVDQSTENIQSIRTVIITSLLGLLGSFILLFTIYQFLTVDYVYPSTGYTSFIISTTLLTVAFLNSKRIRLLQIHQIKQGIGTMGSTQRAIRFYFLKDYMKLLLTPQTQTLVNAGKWVHVRKQGIMALLCASLALLGYLFHLAYTGYLTHNYYFAVGVQTFEHTLNLMRLLKYMLLMPPVAFLILTIKKLIDMVISISR